MSNGRVAPRALRRLGLVSAVCAIVGCQPAERFNFAMDAQHTRVDADGTGGTGGVVEASGGTGGGQFGSGGTGGSGTGGSGTGGSGTGGSIIAGSGGADASTVTDAPQGSGGSVPVDASPDVAADTGADVSQTDSAAEVGVQYCQRMYWTATASASSSTSTRAPAGIDGDLTTRWGNGRFQDGTDWYQVDFGGPVRPDSITLDNTKAYPSDFPGGYAVYASADGQTFTGPIVTGSGTEGKTVIQFPLQTVRAIKINQTGTSRRPFWWQIGEFQIHCP